MDLHIKVDVLHREHTSSFYAYTLHGQVFKRMSWGTSFCFSPSLSYTVFYDCWQNVLAIEHVALLRLASMCQKSRGGSLEVQVRDRWGWTNSKRLRSGGVPETEGKVLIFVGYALRRTLLLSFFFLFSLWTCVLISYMRRTWSFFPMCKDLVNREPWRQLTYSLKWATQIC